MARCFLPCESEAWPEDRRLFDLLSQLQTAEELNSLIENHSKSDPSDKEHCVSVASRLASLSGLALFVTEELTHEEQEQFFRKTLPFITRCASCLDMVVPDGGIPYIQQQEVGSVSLARKVILSLLANALLCTIPHEHPLGGYQQRFVFESFYQELISGDALLRSCQVAKLKCIFNYFDRMLAVEGEDAVGVVYFTRQVMEQCQLPSLSMWSSSLHPLCPVAIDNSLQGIEEESSRTLKVLHTSTCIGGDVLVGGAGEEELRFCTSPEMLAALLMMDEMTVNESIIVTGAERFSSCVKETEGLKFVGNYEEQYERDVYGNVNTATVAIPFTNQCSATGRIYEEKNILCELNRAVTGFLCHDDRGDLNAHLIPVNQWVEDNVSFEIDPSFEADLTCSGLDTSSQVTFDNLDNEEEGDPQAAHSDKQIKELAATVVSEAINRVVKHKDSLKQKDTSNIESVASSLTASILSSAMIKANNNNKETEKVKSVESFAANLVDQVLPAKPGPQPTSVESLVDNLVDQALPRKKQDEVKGTDGYTTEPTRQILSRGSSMNVGSYAVDMARQIITEVKNEILSCPATPVISKPKLVPSNSIGSDSTQGGNVGSGSRRGSRSSSYTGQPLLPDEYAETVVEEAIERGVEKMIREQASGSRHTVPVPQVIHTADPPGDIVLTAPLDRSKLTLQSKVLPGQRDGKDSSRPTIKLVGKHRKTPKPSPGKKLFKKGDNTDGGPVLALPFLQLPVSRMSMAWSVASTRDDESVPTSPTELDQIALNMVSTVEEYSVMLTEIIIRDAIAVNTVPKHLQLTKLSDEPSEEQIGMSYRVQSFLHSLEEASSFTADIQIKGLPPFSPNSHNLRKAVLRPVATSSWSNDGDTQLEAVLQWLAASLCDRPLLKYHTQQSDKLEQLSEVYEYWKEKKVGELFTLVMDYCQQRVKGDTCDNLFTVLLQSKIQSCDN